MIDMGFRLPITVPWQDWWSWMIMRTYATVVIQSAYNEFVKRKEIEDERREIDTMLRECFDHIVIEIE